MYRNFQNTEPNHYKIQLEFHDGSIKTYEEDEEVVVDGGIIKKANKKTLAQRRFVENFF